MPGFELVSARPGTVNTVGLGPWAAERFAARAPKRVLWEWEGAVPWWRVPLASDHGRAVVRGNHAGTCFPEAGQRFGFSLWPPTSNLTALSFVIPSLTWKANPYITGAGGTSSNSCPFTECELGDLHPTRLSASVRLRGC